VTTPATGPPAALVVVVATVEGADVAFDELQPVTNPAAAAAAIDDRKTRIHGTGPNLPVVARPTIVGLTAGAPCSRGRIRPRAIGFTQVAMKPNQSIPPATVIPVLTYPDVRAAVAWLTAAFGFVERVRIGESHRAQMSIGDDGAVIVADVRGRQRPPEEGIVTHLIKVRVEDVDAQFERASSFGAHVVEPAIDHVYGERECTLDDLAGHRWQFTQTLRDVRPEEFGCDTIDPWYHGER
jgi:uncharacterized glyoxalase superfamily protein PhnB